MSNDSALSAAPATTVTSALPADQWDALFAAVTVTLREVATRPKSPAGLTEWPSRETTTLECVRQLELLHDALRGERALAERALTRVASRSQYGPVGARSAGAPAARAQLGPVELLRQHAVGVVADHLVAAQGEGAVAGDAIRAAPYRRRETIHASSDRPERPPWP